MTSQNVVTILIVLVAIGILAARLRRMARGESAGCSSCKTCGASRGVTVTPLIQLGNDLSRKPEPSTTGEDRLRPASP